jgi:hypothetical protein
MLGVRAPTVKSHAWAKPFTPRILALLILNRTGIHAFDYLPVIAFAIPAECAEILTGQYSFRLLRAFYTAIQPTMPQISKPPHRLSSCWLERGTNCSPRSSSLRRFRLSGQTLW